MADTTLLTLLDDVRNKTLRELEGLNEKHARWTPQGLQNSCLWHAGHAFVVTEYLTKRALGQKPEVSAEWMKMFSWESNPAHIGPEAWPTLHAVVQALRQQHAALRDVVEKLTEQQLDALEPTDTGRTVRYAIVHGLHDEARHSGEISLLRKLMRKTFVVETPGIYPNV